MSIRAASEIYDRATRIAVMRRDEMKCFLCAKKEVQIHEVVPRSRFGKENLELCFSVRNRVCLCQRCHERVHTFKWRKELLKRLKYKFGYTYPEKQFQQYQIE